MTLTFLTHLEAGPQDGDLRFQFADTASGNKVTFSGSDLKNLTPTEAAERGISQEGLAAAQYMLGRQTL